MNSYVTIEGFDDLLEEVELQKNSETKKRKAVRAAGQVLIDNISPMLPKKTGKMQDMKQRILSYEGQMATQVYTPVWYDVFQEFGTSQQKANVGKFENEVIKNADNAVKACIEELKNK